MSWTLFYIVIVVFVAAIVVTVSLPWLRKRDQRAVDQLRNAQIVKQRLGEIEKEYHEGLISEDDKQQAITELKLALVDEAGNDSIDESVAKPSSTKLAIIVGLLIALSIGGTVYYRANHLHEVQTLVSATQSIGELSDKLIAVANDQADISPQELQLLALAIRQRLRDTPKDDQAWLNLGRLYMSMGFSEQSIESFERAFTLAPEDVNTRLSFAQALMLSGTDEHLRRSERLLAFELTQQPQNDNIRLMLTVVNAQLGKAEEAQAYFDTIKDKMSPSSEMYQSLVARLAELSGNPSIPIVAEEASAQTQDETNLTGFNVAVSITSELLAKVPENAFLFVFAQDAGSAMRMPAAVVKLPLASLPVNVTLTEQNAMMPNFTLNQIERARLIARISKDENVEAVKGELQGMTEIPTTTGQVVNVEVMINQEIE
ncbi:c-type cytochrome biogenesis protein CcmI [Alteromonas facilis]|uniref:c-type cytochrome biogenesis protein CcmI n=1 Tax=Alteromonas facilis TaxID=2048004 RepID=UPI000C282CBD|nr:c-type cytochrome biogenesis protein CcmI [Alteromonas facilis]